jgi:hypothetical protein
MAQKLGREVKLLPIEPRTVEACYACVRQLSESYAKSPDLPFARLQSKLRLRPRRALSPLKRLTE